MTLAEQEIVKRQPQPQPKPDRVYLPEELNAKVAVLYAAALSVSYELFTKLPFQLEIANKRINSLIEMRRDIEKAITEAIAAEKHDGKLIDEFPEVRRTWPQITRSLLALAVVVSAMAIVFAIKYTPGTYDWLLKFWNESAVIIIGFAIIIMLLTIVIIYGRRKRKKTA